MFVYCVWCLMFVFCFPWQFFCSLEFAFFQQQTQRFLRYGNLVCYQKLVPLHQPVPRRDVSPQVSIRSRYNGCCLQGMAPKTEVFQRQNPGEFWGGSQHKKEWAQKPVINGVITLRVGWNHPSYPLILGHLKGYANPIYNWWRGPPCSKENVFFWGGSLGTSKAKKKLLLSIFSKLRCRPYNDIRYLRVRGWYWFFTRMQTIKILKKPQNPVRFGRFR